MQAGARPADGLDVTEVEDGLVVYEPQRRRVHHLNPTAALVFSLCDGQRQVAELAEDLRRIYELDEAPVDDVQAVVTRLVDEGVLVT